MRTQTPDYPCEYRGNTIYGEKRVSELSPDTNPNLQFVQDSYEIDTILDRIGVQHDRNSVVLDDSYNCLWIDVENGEYSEVWGIHSNVPHNSLFAVRLK